MTANDMELLQDVELDSIQGGGGWGCFGAGAMCAIGVLTCDPILVIGAGFTAMDAC